MDTIDIVTEIDAEISRLQQARALLFGNNNTVKPAPDRLAKTSLPGKAKTAKTMSTEARARISAAQKARWAKSKRAAKKTARAATAAAAVKGITPKEVAAKPAPAKKAVSVKRLARPTAAPAA